MRKHFLCAFRNFLHRENENGVQGNIFIQENIAAAPQMYTDM